MPTYTPEQIYAAARALLPELDAARRHQVESLLEQAEHGEQTDLEILDLLTAEEDLRQRLRDLLKDDTPRSTGERSVAIGGNASGNIIILSEYAPLPGSPQPTPAQIFICPVPGCDYRYIISEAGEKPLPCPKHGLSDNC